MTGLADGIVVGPDRQESGTWIDRSEEEDLVDGNGEEIGKGCGQRRLVVGHRSGCGDGSRKSCHGGSNGVDGGALTGNRHCHRRLWYRRRFHGKNGVDGVSKNLSAVPP